MIPDDIKVWCPIRSLPDSRGLQDDLENLNSGSDQWLLRFNAAKCKVMPVGRKFPTVCQVRYWQNTQASSVVEKEKNLGSFLQRIT